MKGEKSIMRRNSEYMGVNEEFIPESERYVQDSILGNREETKISIKRNSCTFGN